MRSAAAHPAMSLLVLNVGWFACVLGAARGLPALGPAVVAALVVGRVLLGRGRRGELALFVLAAGLGYAADSALVLAGVIEFPTAARVGSPSPVWMVALWVNLSASLHRGLAPLQRRPILAALVGAAAGPLAYIGGARLGAIVLLGDPWVSSAIIALEWAVALPLLLGAARLTAAAAERRAARIPNLEEARA